MLQVQVFGVFPDERFKRLDRYLRDVGQLILNILHQLLDHFKLKGVGTESTSPQRR